METILRMVERKYGKARRIWGMDRGIVSEENLAAIRKRAGQYLVGTPRRQMKQFEAELLLDNWTQVRPDVQVKQVAIPQGEETYMLCRTTGRKEKEKAIRQRFSTHMETALRALEKSIANGRLKDRHKMERRRGGIQARHPQVNDLFEVTLRDTPVGVRLVWEMKADRKAWRDLREGAYMLPTKSAGGFGGGVGAEIQATHRSRGVVSRAQERAFDQAFVSSEGAAGQGPRAGGLSGLCPLGDPEASAEASACDNSPSIGERSV
jgi:hypothetical protein